MVRSHNDKEDDADADADAQMLTQMLTKTPTSGLAPTTQTTITDTAGAELPSHATFLHLAAKSYFLRAKISLA